MRSPGIAVVVLGGGDSLGSRGKAQLGESGFVDREVDVPSIAAAGGWQLSHRHEHVADVARGNARPTGQAVHQAPEGDQIVEELSATGRSLLQRARKPGR